MDSAQDTLTGGLPHSETPGSPIARISPGLFAACHVLHRLSVPRHPPDALNLRLIPAFPSRRKQAPTRKRRTNRRAQGQNPGSRIQRKPSPATAGTHRREAASHEDTSRIRPAQTLRLPAGEAALRQKGRGCAARPIRLGHMTNSLFTLQSTSPPRASAPERYPLKRFSKRRRMPTDGAHRWCPQMVEVNGFEPMTSCLQSRRSPN